MTAITHKNSLKIAEQNKFYVISFNSNFWFNRITPIAFGYMRFYGVLSRFRSCNCLLPTNTELNK